MDKDLISIIVPVYNVEKYLDKCIQSVVNQTYKNIEIILINDGSTDSSLEICKRYAKTDNRIKIISQENQGLSMARNAGIKFSRGKFLAFVDSDDFIDSDMIEVLYKNLKETNSQISSCKSISFRGKEEKVKFRKDGDTINLNPIQTLKGILIDDKKRMIEDVIWNKLYAKNIFDKMEFIPGRNSEDVEILYKLILKCKNISHTNKQCYAYRIRDNSISHKFKKKTLVDEIEFVKSRYVFLTNNYLELSEHCHINRIIYAYRYHVKTCLGKNWEFYNSKEMIDEYIFYKNYYKKIKDKIRKKNFMFDLLYLNRTIFYLIGCQVYKMKKKP